MTASVLHTHKTVASYYKVFGLFGLTITYCLAMVISLVSVMYLIYVGGMIPLFLPL